MQVEPVRHDLAQRTLGIVFIVGLLAFGLIGLFLGPTILAVGYTLFDAWIAEAPLPEKDMPPVTNEAPRHIQENPEIPRSA